MEKPPISLRDMISFIRVRVRQGGWTTRGDAATCPAELMLNIDAILDAAERAALTTTEGR